MAVLVDRRGGAGAAAGEQDSGDRAVVDREGQGAFQAEDVLQQHVDHPAVGEGDHGVGRVRGGDEIGDRGQYPVDEGGPIDLVGQMTGFDALVARPEIALGLLDRDVGG